MFNAAQRSYCVTRKEMAALIFGLRHFRTYLLGRPFLVRVDHMAITFYRSTPEPVGQQARYLDFMAQFDMELEYRAGVRHTNCDVVSRLRPCEVAAGSHADSATGGLLAGMQTGCVQQRCRLGQGAEQSMLLGTACCRRLPLEVGRCNRRLHKLEAKGIVQRRSVLRILWMGQVVVLQSLIGLPRGQLPLKVG